MWAKGEHFQPLIGYKNGRRIILICPSINLFGGIMENKVVVNGKKETPFLQTPTGQVVLLAATGIFSGFCMAVGGGLYNKVAGTNKSIASREDGVIDFPVRKVA